MDSNAPKPAKVEKVLDRTGSRGGVLQVRVQFSRESAPELVSRSKISDAILGLVDKNLITKTIPGESKVFFQQVKGDNYRHLAESTDGDAKSKAAEYARLAHAEAASVAEKDLLAAHPIRLGLASFKNKAP